MSVIFEYFKINVNDWGPYEREINFLSNVIETNLF